MKKVIRLLSRRSGCQTQKIQRGPATALQTISGMMEEKTSLA